MANSDWLKALQNLLLFVMTVLNIRQEAAISMLKVTVSMDFSMAKAVKCFAMQNMTK